MLSRGCIAYGRSGGYIYIDWRGNVTPCAFVPYYVDNIYDLYNNGKILSDALFSGFMKNGRRWQREYGFGNWKKPKNWLMPCSIRDHYEIFRNSILPKDAKPEDEKAKEALESDEFYHPEPTTFNRLIELQDHPIEDHLALMEGRLRQMEKGKSPLANIFMGVEQSPFTDAIQVEPLSKGVKVPR